MSPERRAAILGHIAAIASRPWQGETRAEQRVELDTFAACLKARGEHADGPVMVAITDARNRIGR